MRPNADQARRFGWLFCAKCGTLTKLVAKVSRVTESFDWFRVTKNSFQILKIVKHTGQQPLDEKASEDSVTKPVNEYCSSVAISQTHRSTAVVNLDQ